MPMLASQGRSSPLSGWPRCVTKLKFLSLHFISKLNANDEEIYEYDDESDGGEAYYDRDDDYID